MAITFPASPADGATYTNPTTGVQYIYNATDGVWKTSVWPTNTNYLQLSGGTLTGDLTTTGITVSNSVSLPNGAITRDNLATTAKGSILQIAQDIDDGEDSTTSTSFVDSNLILASFPNPIQSTSKVYATIQLLFGESYSGAWAQPHYFTLFQGTDVADGANIGDATRGMAGGNAVSSASDSYNMYDMQNLTASLLHTPTNTNPYYRLFYRTVNNSRSVFIGSSGFTGVVYDVGRTIVTIMEVAQ